MRPDSLADAYYNDSELDWLLYITNEIVDPYYGWYLNEHEFDSFIANKYGSLEDALKKTKFYRNNWPTDESEISASFYDNNLALDQKQYYTPNFGPKRNILSYSRKREDWVVNTNKIIQYQLTYTSGNTFTAEEIVDLKDGGEILGGGEVVTSNSTYLIIQHVSGNVTANSTWLKEITGETSTTVADTANSNVLEETITDTTNRYWDRITLFDWETEKNESKKNLLVMNKDYTIELAEQLRLKLLE